MTEKEIHHRIIKNRAAFYNCSTETFQAEGNTYRIREFEEGPHHIYITKLYKHYFITCGSKLADSLKALNKTITLEFLKEHYPSLKLVDSYPHYIYKKKSIESKPLPAGYDIRAMESSFHPPLQKFLDACTPEDIEDALIELDDPDDEIRMVFFGDMPVAYAGYRLWDNGLGDVGILTLPGHRKMGLGIAAVAEATKACLENGYIPFYRTSRENRGSQAIAEGLGYEFIWRTYECNCTG
ncbi:MULTISPECIES: GNAT family N-acetyltransferase [unclassified Oceanispirochaeta]|uniref:GNAT family N-acetyltransferase n=1 Tax=unclassified Oceanispirochaeta TaxID=2635722 RepID=UPI000E098C7D|nr:MULTISPECIES: GNAT family N-acetyltransferase [unclassified Oceanispirochaeta]MBF9017696.1 GNAT family N-acetyltransferase [Oceanispirochaeta sp. M2]NPD72099.1 GNAT family N-acetyltransferase [Oceanispirochaeta sp. M1]RDG32542.1 GNAT family N-acetyltransferase [Oceanispirochaeta sp. M1]